MEVGGKKKPFDQSENHDPPNGNHIQSLSSARQLQQTVKLETEPYKPQLLISQDLKVRTYILESCFHFI